MKRLLSTATLALFAIVLVGSVPRAHGALTTVVEASISDVHAAIRAGEITCVDVVQAYLKRARAYNGTCTWLVTADGAPIPAVPGWTRAGVPLTFPTDTVPVASVLPNVNEYAGLPLEFGSMQPTSSDPSVYQQRGMRVGIPNVGQVNGIETFNLRGERSVVCQGGCDNPPGQPNAAGCRRLCEDFRQQPDALERAAQLDAQYGRNIPADLPMYCVPVAVKDPYDTKDMRTTSNADVAFRYDAPPFDSMIAAQFRAKGAILYAKSTAHEFNAGPGNPGVPSGATAAQAQAYFPSGVSAISGWGGQACNPFDTEREPRGSSSGVGVTISANLAMVGVCEQSGASCQGPASRNGIALILPTAGVMPDSGGIGNQFFIDRAGLYGKTLKDAVIALDSIKDAERGYFDPATIYTAIPKTYVPEAPYSSFVVDSPGPESLRGKRVAIVREWMVKHTPNDVEISDKIDAQIKSVLRDQLGAELVETFDPDYPDDPTVPNVGYTFQDAMAEILPQLRPNLFTRGTADNRFYGVPGFDVTSFDYLLNLSLGTAPASPNLNLRNLTGGTAASLNVKFSIDRYLKQRGDSVVVDWPSWVANATFRQDASRVGALNWIQQTSTIAAGNREAIARSQVGQMIVLKVMYENGIDVFVMPENTLPPRKIGRASSPSVKGRGAVSGASGLFTQLELPLVAVPAGFVEKEFEPQFTLNAAKTAYTDVAGSVQTDLPNPMPISMLFWGGPGDDATLIEVGSAYEAASRHRTSPPLFGPVPDEL